MPIPIGLLSIGGVGDVKWGMRIKKGGKFVFKKRKRKYKGKIEIKMVK